MRTGNPGHELTHGITGDEALHQSFLPRYTITVEAGTRRPTVWLSDPVTEPARQRLLDFLRARVKEQRSEGR